MNIEVIIHVYFLVTMCCNLIEQEKKQVLMKLTLLAWLYSPPVVHIFSFSFCSTEI